MKGMMSPLEVECAEAVTGAAVGHETHSCPAVHSCQGCVTQREELGIDDGEHGLAASVAVTQRELQQVQEALWKSDGRQQVVACRLMMVKAVQDPHG